MAAELTEHWAPTFVRRNIDKEDLLCWLQELKSHGSLPSICPDAMTAHKWRIRAKDIRWAIKTTERTAPGPDGISAAHWKHLGPQGVKALLQVARCLLRAVGAEPAAERCLPAAFARGPAAQDATTSGGGGMACCEAFLSAAAINLLRGVTPPVGGHAPLSQEYGRYGSETAAERYARVVARPVDSLFCMECRQSYSLVHGP